MVDIVDNNAHPPVPMTSVTRTPDIVLNHVTSATMATGLIKPVAMTVSGAVTEKVEDVLLVLCTDMVIFVKSPAAPTVKQQTAVAAYATEIVGTALADALIECMALPATTAAQCIVSSVITLIPAFPVYRITGGNSVKSHVPLIV